MGVTVKHKTYEASIKRWQRCRDCYEGSDAVKARKAEYLPPLDSHALRPEKYEEYLLRAMFYNATGRTVDGLAGAIFQKAPTFDIPDAFKDHVSDITLTGISAELFALKATREVLTTGRAGVLIDMSSVPGPDQRPYWVQYRAEDIVNWRTERRNGDEVLTLVVLREEAEDKDPADPFGKRCVTQYRVLELAAAGYTQTVWRKKSADVEEWVPYAPGDGDPVVVPLRRGVPLDFIPFVFVGPTSTSPDVEKPPLMDLVEVNLSHYRLNADMEHGLHYVGVPVLVIIGITDDSPLKFGASNALLLPKDGSAQILQVDGEMFGALERADERKRKLMATLGARLLEDQPAAAETMGAVAMRHSGEHATLRTIAQAVEQGLALALRFHIWWTGTEKRPGDVKVAFELNKDFFAVKASPDEVRAALMAFQADGISFETFYTLLQKGGWTREGVKLEDEKVAIEGQIKTRMDRMPDFTADPDPTDPSPKPGDSPFRKAA